MRRFRGNKKRVLAYIGLESGAPDRVAYLQQAVQMLKFINLIELLDCSSFYETEPEANSGSSKEKNIWPLTAVTAIETALSGDELLEVIRDIESLFPFRLKRHQDKVCNQTLRQILLL
jgi:7,8-dihydro-6-hydroxymethylpterin-pyrophosphokinase